MMGITWMADEDQALAMLTGLPLRDELSRLLALNWPVPEAGEPSVPEWTPSSDPPLPARLAAMDLVAILRHKVRSHLGGRLPSLEELLTVPACQEAIDRLVGQMRDAASYPIVETSQVNLLTRALVALVTEVYAEELVRRIRKVFAASLGDLATLLDREAKRAAGEWDPHIDGAPHVYRSFSPDLVELVTKRWHRWHGEVMRLHQDMRRVAAVECAVTEKEIA